LRRRTGEAGAEPRGSSAASAQGGAARENERQRLTRSTSEAEIPSVTIADYAPLAQPGETGLSQTSSGRLRRRTGEAGAEPRGLSAASAQGGAARENERQRLTRCLPGIGGFRVVP